MADLIVYKKFDDIPARRFKMRAQLHLYGTLTFVKFPGDS
jgi:hypothetical protein